MDRDDFKSFAQFGVAYIWCLLWHTHTTSIVNGFRHYECTTCTKWMDIKVDD